MSKAVVVQGLAVLERIEHYQMAPESSFNVITREVVLRVAGPLHQDGMDLQMYE